MNKQKLEESIKIAFEKGEKEQLETLSKEAVSSYPSDAFGYAYLAEFFMMESPVPYDKAEICIAKASELSPKNIQYLSQFAHIKSEMGESDIAQIIWAKILLIEPNNLEALTAQGNYQLYTVKDTTKAIELFDQAIASHIDNPSGYINRAIAYTELEEYEKALNDYNHALELGLEETNVQDLSLKLTILTQLEKQEEVLDTYDKILSIDDSMAAYHVNYAQLLYARAQYEKAAKHYGKALELLESNDPFLLYPWGESLYKSQQYDKALEAFNSYVEHSDDPELGLLMQIKSKIKLGQAKEALKSIKKAQKSTKDAYKKDQLITLECEALIGLEDYKEAGKILKPIFENPGPFQIESHYLLGKLCFLMGDPHSAYQLLKTAAGQNHEESITFVRDELHDLAYSVQQATFENNQAVLEKNATSEFIQKIEGTIWRFADIISQGFSESSEEAIASVKDGMFLTTLVVTKKALLQVSRQGVSLSIYRINEESPEGIVAEFYPLDQFGSGMAANISLLEDGSLKYGQDEEYLLLKPQGIEDLDPGIKAQLTKFIKRDVLELMGEGITPLADLVWSA
jgi:tetratricopeptide (TPR) repeat protein